MTLIQIENAVSKQVHIKNFQTLNASKDEYIQEKMPLILIAGIWDQQEGAKGEKSFCKFYPVHKKTYQRCLAKFKYYMNEIANLYIKYEVIDNSIISLMYNFKKITGFNLQKIVSQKIYRRKVYVEIGYPDDCFQAIRMYIKLELIQNYLFLRFGNLKNAVMLTNRLGNLTS